MNDLKFVDNRTMEKNKRTPLSPRLRFQILRRDGYTCQYCGKTGKDSELEIDHVIPVSRGGTNDEGNLQVACRDCNRGKMADEIISDNENIHVVEKVVYRDVEKIVYKETNEQHVNKINDLSRSPIQNDYEKFQSMFEKLSEKHTKTSENLDYNGATAAYELIIELKEEICKKYGCICFDDLLEKVANEQATFLANEYIKKIESSEMTYDEAIIQLQGST